MPVPDEIYARVREECSCKPLSVEQDDINPPRRCGGDLGAESIDFLDIVFRLEGVRDPDPARRAVPRAGLAGSPGFRTGESSHRRVPGRIAARGCPPGANLQVLERDRQLSRIKDLFTVELLANYIEWKLGASVKPTRYRGAGPRPPSVIHTNAL